MIVLRYIVIVLTYIGLRSHSITSRSNSSLVIVSSKGEMPYANIISASCQRSIPNNFAALPALMSPCRNSSITIISFPSKCTTRCVFKLTSHWASPIRVNAAQYSGLGYCFIVVSIACRSAWALSGFCSICR